MDGPVEDLDDEGIGIDGAATYLGSVAKLSNLVMERSVAIGALARRRLVCRCCRFLRAGAWLPAAM